MIKIYEAGYSGYSMSNNAVDAYENGEKPKSKWTKQDILSAVSEINPDIVDDLKKISLPLLKDKLLYNSSWHHTSNYYNKTEFYSVDEDVVVELTPDIINSWENKAVNKNNGVKKGDIDYIVWTGTRKHPKANKKQLTDVNIEERGSFYIVTDDNGNEILRKKIGSNGTYVRYK